MFLVLMFLKWFIPTFGDIGFIVWIAAGFGIAYWLQTKGSAA